MSERTKGTMFRYVDKRVQPVGVELVWKITGSEAKFVELQVVINGDWHETIVVDKEAVIDAAMELAREGALQPEPGKPIAPLTCRCGGVFAPDPNNEPHGWICRKCGRRI